MTKLPLADLHVHTTASDGTRTPAETVHEAARVGLSAVGIADHDTIGGIPEALITAEEVGIIVVPAVEINTDFGDTEIHMLGYFVQPDSPSLAEHLKTLRDARFERGRKIVEKLNEIGVHISMDRVEEISGGGAIGRPHIARALVEAGYVGGMNGAFGKYLVRGTPSYVPRYKLTPFQAIDIIRDAGGVPVLAHPGTNKHDEMVPSLVEAGLKGIEVYHTEHAGVQSRRYRKMAERYGLIPTGGSDSHGPNNVKTVEIGSVTVNIEVVHRLKEASSEPGGVLE